MRVDMRVVVKKFAPAAKKPITDRIDKSVAGTRKPITARLEQPSGVVRLGKTPNEIVAVAEEDFWTDDDDDKDDSNEDDKAGKANANEERRKFKSPQKVPYVLRGQCQRARCWQMLWLANMRWRILTSIPWWFVQ